MRGFECPKCGHSSRDHTDTTCNHCGKCDGVSSRDTERFYNRMAHTDETAKKSKKVEDGPLPLHWPCEGCGLIVNYPALGCGDCEGRRCQECCPGKTPVERD